MSPTATSRSISEPETTGHVKDVKLYILLLRKHYIVLTLWDAPRKIHASCQKTPMPSVTDVIDTSLLTPLNTWTGRLRLKDRLWLIKSF